MEGTRTGQGEQTRYLDLIPQPLESLVARGCSEDEESKHDLQANAQKNSSPAHLGTKSRTGTEAGCALPSPASHPFDSCTWQHHHPVPWVRVAGV